MSYDFRDASYSHSAHKLAQLPPDNGAEVAFAGRSNAGKSSAINAITGKKTLARTSKTPGRTQMINFFTLDPEHRLVDLPGYGYARVPLATKEHWQKTLGRYLQTRQCLRGLILIMDSRHPLTSLDEQLLQWCQQAELSVHILLSKADKLSRGAGANTLQQLRQQLQTRFPGATAQLFSASKRQGIDDAQQQLRHWLDE